MKHRGIKPGYEWTTAAIADVLDRGTADDWRELASRIRADRSGTYARAVRQILAHMDLYGTKTLWLDYLDRHEFD